MPERTIKVSLAYYTNPDGISVMAHQGDKVEVHAAHVKRFDELNVLPERFIDEPAGMDDADAPLVYPGDAPEEDKPRRGRPRKTDAGD